MPEVDGFSAISGEGDDMRGIDKPKTTYLNRRRGRIWIGFTASNFQAFALLNVVSASFQQIAVGILFQSVNLCLTHIGADPTSNALLPVYDNVSPDMPDLDGFRRAVRHTILAGGALVLQAHAPVLLNCDRLFKIGENAACEFNFTEQCSVSHLDRFGALRRLNPWQNFILHELVVYRKESLGKISNCPVKITSFRRVD